MTDDLPSFARKMIRLLDMQTGTPVGIYLEPDNTLNLDHVRLMYPNATTVKCLFPDQNVPCLLPCDNKVIRAPFGIWSDQVYEPIFPSHIVQPIVNLLEIHSRGYAPCQLTNLSEPRLSLEAELLVDCGCSVDLILPSREIEKLKLRREPGGVAARCFNHRVTELPKYEYVKLTINLKNPMNGQSAKKSAVLSVFERLPIATSDAEVQCSGDQLFHDRDHMSSTLFSPERNFQAIPSTTLIDESLHSNVSILKLSPLKHPNQINDRYGIIGYPAMTKLNIAIHFGGNYIFTIERLLEYVSQSTNVAAD